MDELRDKLIEAENILGQMAEHANRSADEFEQTRLLGKCEGVKLARSYLRDYAPNRIWVVLNKNGSVGRVFWSAEDANDWADYHPETSQRVHSYPISPMGVKS